MKRAIETRPGPKRLAYLALTLTILAGCEEAFSTSESAEKPEENSGKTELLPDVTTSSKRDVEAPEVFQTTEAGLWDGRPSLGGVWVAHPDVSQPERVVIRNTSNNKSVTGALFRRERDLPGPALQVSSAAAKELGMLAGAPTKVSVVALRREKLEEPSPEDAPEAEESAAETTAAAADGASDTQASTDSEKPAKRKWWQKKEPAVAAAGTAAVAAGTDSASDETAENAETASEDAETPTSTDDQVDTPAEKPAKRKWWQKKAPAAAAAGTAVAAADTATDSADVAAEAVVSPSLSDAPVTPPAEPPAKRKWWQKKDPAAITETPLDPVEGAAAAIDASEATPVAAATTSATPLSKPFVQIGTFSVEANAKSAAQKVRRNGMPTVVRELKTANSTVWRVLVGPAATRAERKAFQKDVKDLGFKDAFTVTD